MSDVRVVVTGAARGMGLATARTLLASGHGVIAIDHFDTSLAHQMPPTRDALEDLARDHPDRLSIIDLDIADDEALLRTRNELLAEGPPIGGIVCAAGIIAGAPRAQELPAAKARRIYEVNVLGVGNTVRAFLDDVISFAKDSGWGRLVVVSSAGAQMALPRLADYVASKWAVTGYVKTIALELGGTGVTANLVAPGSTDTQMIHDSAEIYELSDPNVFIQDIPLRRLLAPEEIARAIAFLYSRDADGITGAIIPIDGGLSIPH